MIYCQKEGTRVHYMTQEPWKLGLKEELYIQDQRIK